MQFIVEREVDFSCNTEKFGIVVNYIFLGCGRGRGIDAGRKHAWRLQCG